MLSIGNCTSENIFFVFTVYWGDPEGVGTFCPPCTQATFKSHALLRLIVFLFYINLTVSQIYRLLVLFSRLGDAQPSHEGRRTSSFTCWLIQFWNLHRWNIIFAYVWRLSTLHCQHCCLILNQIICAFCFINPFCHGNHGCLYQNLMLHFWQMT